MRLVGLNIIGEVNILNKYVIDPHNSTSISRLIRQGHWWGNSRKLQEDLYCFKIKNNIQQYIYSNDDLPESYKGKKRNPYDFW